MSVFYPHERYHRISDVSPQSLILRGIHGVVLDVDNTLTTHDNPVPANGVLEWLNLAREAGLKLIVLSNNSPERVRPFAEMLGLDFEANGQKPLPIGYRRTLARLKLSANEAVAIGDQIFTDVLGARLAGIYCIFVDPIELEHTNFFKFKRWLERPILAGFEGRKQRLIH